MRPSEYEESCLAIGRWRAARRGQVTRVGILWISIFDNGKNGCSGPAFIGRLGELGYYWKQGTISPRRKFIRTTCLIPGSSRVRERERIIGWDVGEARNSPESAHMSASSDRRRWCVRVFGCYFPHNIRIFGSKRTIQSVRKEHPYLLITVAYCRTVSVINQGKPRKRQDKAIKGVKERR